MKIKERNIVTAILLSVVTCGIYGIYWFVVLVDDVKAASGDASLPSGGTAFLLTLITCGIYGFYLFYKLGKAMYVANTNAGKSASDNSVLYLVLQLFQLGIVNYCLIQSELNNLAKES